MLEALLYLIPGLLVVQVGIATDPAPWPLWRQLAALTLWPLWLAAYCSDMYQRTI